MYSIPSSYNKYNDREGFSASFNVQSSYFSPYEERRYNSYENANKMDQRNITSITENQYYNEAQGYPTYKKMERNYENSIYKPRSYFDIEHMQSYGGSIQGRILQLNHQISELESYQYDLMRESSNYGYDNSRQLQQIQNKILEACLYREECLRAFENYKKTTLDDHGGSQDYNENISPVVIQHNHLQMHSRDDPTNHPAYQSDHSLPFYHNKNRNFNSSYQYPGKERQLPEMPQKELYLGSPYNEIHLEAEKPQDFHHETCNFTNPTIQLKERRNGSWVLLRRSTKPMDGKESGNIVVTELWDWKGRPIFVNKIEGGSHVSDSKQVSQPDPLMQYSDCHESKEEISIKKVEELNTQLKDSIDKIYISKEYSTGERENPKEEISIKKVEELNMQLKDSIDKIYISKEYSSEERESPKEEISIKKVEELNTQLKDSIDKIYISKEYSTGERESPTSQFAAEESKGLSLDIPAEASVGNHSEEEENETEIKKE